MTWQEYEQDLEARLTGSRVAFIEEHIELNPRDESKSQRVRKGYFSLWRKATKRMVAKLRQIKQQLQHRRHEPTLLWASG